MFRPGNDFVMKHYDSKATWGGAENSYSRCFNVVNYVMCTMLVVLLIRRQMFGEHLLSDHFQQYHKNVAQIYFLFFYHNS